MRNYFQNDPGLLKIQNEVSLLLFRYLKYKLRSSEEASKTMSLLLKLVGDLHACLSIHLHGRPAREPSHNMEAWELEQLFISPHPEPSSFSLLFESQNNTGNGSNITACMATTGF